jgi:HEAT repeat protein
MKFRNHTIAALALTLALSGAGLAVAVQPADEVVELLSATANSPSKSRIDQVMGPTAVADLIEIADDTSAEADPGLRIRAYNALRHFAQTPESETVRLALQSAVALRTSETSGTQLLYLRAAMLSMAEVGMETSVPDLLGLLAHPSRDIRAACAQALGITGSDDAILPLRDRALIETELQVQVAIADALFELDSD